MFRKIIIFIFVANIFTTFTKSFSQELTCGYTEEFIPNTIPTNTQGQGKFFRVLIIYITFRDDIEVGPSAPENIWAKPVITPTFQPTKPMNHYQTGGRMIDTAKADTSVSYMTRYSEYTYSDYFCEMSRGTFDFIGDEVKVILPYAAAYCSDTAHYIGLQILDSIALRLADSIGVDFTRYDNWNNDNSSFGADGFVDFVIFQYRRVPGIGDWFYINPSAGGSTDPIRYDSALHIDGKIIYKGIWTIANLVNTTHTQVLNEHEFFHYIYNFDHQGFNSGHVSIGMLTEGSSNSTYCLTPMERSVSNLNWTTPTIVDSNHLQSSYTLRDFISTGDELKVKIPNTNPAEYYWISNHQKVSKYDGVSRGSFECWQTNKYKQDPYCDEGKGLYIFHQSDTGCANNVFGYVTDYRHYPFDLISSEGRFKWDTLRTVYDANLGNLRLMKEILGSRDSGVSEFNKYKLNSNYWSAQLITDDFCSLEPNDYFITGDFHGDGLDAYNIGYDEIFSPYSNPTTRSCQNPAANNGLTIKLLSQDTSGAITLKIYYDDEDALHDLPPSKPKNVKVTAVFTSDTLSFYPKITWDPNIEPDFIFPTYGDYLADPQYEIYKGVSSYCEDEPEYALIASLPNTVTQFTDSSYLVRYYSQGPYTDRTFSYKVVAKDNRGNKSLKSERGLISGYLETEGGQEEGRFTIQENDNLPAEYSIKNYPNPFNPETKIQYELPIDNFVTIKIYDILGKEIYRLVNEFKTAGRHNIIFNGGNLSSGIYYYRIAAGNYEQIRKMILIK